jgi:hypothetical protein
MLSGRAGEGRGVMTGPVALQSNHARLGRFKKSPAACAGLPSTISPVVQRLRANLTNQEIV